VEEEGIANVIAKNRKVIHHGVGKVPATNGGSTQGSRETKLRSANYGS
jgi:hypothetical protein